MAVNVSRLPPGFKNEPPAGRVFDSKIYLGIVKDNRDIQRMGRLRVYIPEIGGDPTSEAHWYVVSYASPFAGASDIDAAVRNAKNMQGSQQSYGFWFVPPDLNNEVLITFLNGEATRGIWFACLYQQYMNHMTPGIPANVATTGETECGSLPPVVEYNKKDDSVVPPEPARPTFDPLVSGLCSQGLFQDAVRGPSSSGARRETPSHVFGIKTPRGQHFVMDDNLDSEFIRIRTRSGTQILVSETTGFVYINSRLGNSWLEISDSGIDMYSKGDISLRSEQNINLRADGDVNIDAGQNLNGRGLATIKLNSGTDTHIAASGNIFAQALQSINVKAGQNLLLDGLNSHLKGDQALHLQGGALSLKASAALTAQGDTLNLKSTNDQIRFSANGKLYDQSIEPADAADATAAGTALTKQAISLPDTTASAGACCPTHTTTSTIVSRMPAHEPWSVHQTRDTKTPPPVQPPRGGALTPSSTNSVVEQRSAIKTTPGQNTVSRPSSRKVTTGSGERSINTSASLGPPVAGTKVPQDIAAYEQEASSMTGVSVGYLTAMTDMESSFNPNAQASGSSATGLNQFLPSTFNDMLNKKTTDGQTYGEALGLTPDDIDDPRASVLMGAVYAQQNEQALQPFVNDTLGRDVTNTDLYMAHFLGASGAKQMLGADSDALGVDVNPKAAKANPAIFFVNSDPNQPRTTQQIYSLLQARIEPKAATYEAALSSPPTT